MTNPLFDDVKALLDKDFGDDRILKQIFRACENNEIISNYERNYVRKLAEKYLGKRPEIIQTQTPVIEKPIVPDVNLSEIPSVLKPQILQPTSSQIFSSKSKNPKIMLGVGIIALVIIIVSVVSFTSTDISQSIGTPTISNSITLSIQTDLSSYNKKDLISISGISATGIVNLSIENQSNELVWAEQVSVKNNSRYSTLAIAGGPGWEISGTYTIKVDNGVDTKSNTFSFTV
ncbi:MAG: hypothetical protein ABGW49_05435 [Nitrosopumilus sp.]|jgi:hypothetical protein